MRLGLSGLGVVFGHVRFAVTKDRLRVFQAELLAHNVRRCMPELMRNPAFNTSERDSSPASEILRDLMLPRFNRDHPGDALPDSEQNDPQQDDPNDCRKHH